MKEHTQIQDICGATVELSTTRDDWRVVREIYVAAFRRYPLYEYAVPDATKRDCFLRAYLDANYHVTVGNGKGILLTIKVAGEDVNGNAEKKLVGGVLFVPPASDGRGWAAADDEPYALAYEKFGLERISPEGFRRLRRYEEWEEECVFKPVIRTAQAPMWNGAFCALTPEYACKGIGSLVFKQAICVMTDYWLSAKRNTDVARQQQESGERKLAVRCRWTRFLSRLRSSRDLRKHRRADKLTRADSDASTAPVVIAFSHSERAVNFHTANGFRSIAQISYHDATDDVTPFSVHVLGLDPFRIGNLQRFT